MLIIFGIMVLGIILGRIFLSKKKTSYLPKIITFIVWALLFALGLEVGANQTIMSNLDTLGLSAFLIALSSLIGSILLSYLLWKWINKNKK